MTASVVSSVVFFSLMIAACRSVGGMLGRLGTTLTYSVAVTTCVAVAGLTHISMRSRAPANESLQLTGDVR